MSQATLQTPVEGGQDGGGLEEAGSRSCPSHNGQCLSSGEEGRHRDAYGWGGGQEWGDQFHLGQKLCPLSEQESPPGAPRAGSKGR